MLFIISWQTVYIIFIIIIIVVLKHCSPLWTIPPGLWPLRANFYYVTFLPILFHIISPSLSSFTSFLCPIITFTICFRILF